MHFQEVRMIQLFRAGDNRPLGEISEAQLQFLVDQMEEEFPEDQDYAITALVLAYFQEQGIELALLNLLREALGEQDEVVIRWARS
jgi:hypothetical protein